MTKHEIREYVANQKSGMGHPILEANGTVAIRRLKELKEFQQAKTVGAFAPQLDLVDVSIVMSNPERTFYIPAFDEESKSYRLAKMGETFKRSQRCGLEPVDPIFADKDEIDLILIHGCAFDDLGNRLGPEEDIYTDIISYYNAIRVGICFDCQCLAQVPSSTPKRMNVVISESRSVNTHNQ